MENTCLHACKLIKPENQSEKQFSCRFCVSEGGPASQIRDPWLIDLLISFFEGRSIACAAVEISLFLYD